jgi:bifunctional UDP-N-acetylglucosamine pyrophosphorylase/glucosamine-1-phosphate N-acetyltransferase
MTPHTVDIVVLAAGKGTRMRSARPKVLQPLAGRPLLFHVLDTAEALAPAQGVVVVGHEAAQVTAALAAWYSRQRVSASSGNGPTAPQKAPEQTGSDIWRTVAQTPQLGTGHALQVALPALADSPARWVLVLYGDVPLIRPSTLVRLVAAATACDGVALLTVTLENPSGYGRIVRDGAGGVAAIVEEKDADEATRAVREVNTGVMVLPKARLAAWLAALTPNNVQEEYYLTDVVARAVAEGVPVVAVQPETVEETLGVNDKRQLAELERIFQRQTAEQLLAAGVTLLDPARFDVRGELTCGRDVTIDVGCLFLGEVVLYDDVVVGAHSVLQDCVVGPGTRIEPFSHIVGAQIGANAVIGPYARIRPKTVLADGVHIGNFVEVKNSEIGEGSKANHLSYLGDATVGSRVNIGAGTITCNYDGANKYRTVIEDDAFIGSDTQLVAPVRVGRGATLGAGTTLTKDAPPEALTLSRAPQRSITGWKRPQKKR